MTKPVHMSAFEVSAYLNCIRYQGNLQLSRQNLFALQRQHLLSVPFENLDIHNHKPIRLDLESIFRKVVHHNRGGFCYELNGLFYALLTAIGFDAWMISARVHKKEGSYSPEFDHMALLVKVDGDTYLVDVGFGSFCLEPLLLRKEVILKDPHGQFIFDQYDDGHYRISQLEEDEKVPQYIFSTHARKLEEFSPMCQYHQQSPQSHFTQKKIISLARENGRITLSNDRIKISHAGETEEERFDPILFEKKLDEIFGIMLMGNY